MVIALTKKIHTKIFVVVNVEFATRIIAAVIAIHLAKSITFLCEFGFESTLLCRPLANSSLSFLAASGPLVQYSLSINDSLRLS